MINLAANFDPHVESYLRTLRGVGKTLLHSDALKIQALADRLRVEGKAADYRLFPITSAQNAVSSGTLFGLGGAGGNMTLAGSTLPTLGASGLPLNGTDQYGSIADFLGTETITVFFTVAQASATPTSTQTLLSQYVAGAANRRSWLISQFGAEANDPYGINRSSNGTADSGALETYRSPGSLGSTSPRTIVGQFVQGGGRSLWFGDTSLTLSLTFGTAQTARFNSPDPIFMGAASNNGTPENFAAGTFSRLLIVRGALTDAQRLAIRALFDAL
jgi:hypothetical protein